MVLLLAPPVLAADLELTLTLPGQAPATVTAHDIAPGRLPALIDVPIATGGSLRIATSVSAELPTWHITVEAQRILGGSDGSRPIATWDFQLEPDGSVGTWGYSNRIATGRAGLEDIEFSVRATVRDADAQDG